ncbi:unnamed protein product, partial [Gulo gulo]
MLPRAGVDAGMLLPSTGRSPGGSSPPRQSGGSSPPGRAGACWGVRVPLAVSGGSSPPGQ